MTVSDVPSGLERNDDGRAQHSELNHRHARGNLFPVFSDIKVRVGVNFRCHDSDLILSFCDRRVARSLMSSGFDLLSVEADWAELNISNCFKIDNVIIVALGRDRGFGKPEDVVHTSPLGRKA